jgi:hypothetical protein
MKLFSIKIFHLIEDYRYCLNLYTQEEIEQVLTEVKLFIDKYHDPSDDNECW